MSQEQKENEYVWHTLEKKEVLQALKTDDDGLSDDEARYRLETQGRNELPNKKADSWFRLALRQFASPLVYILLLVVIITFVLGEIVDGSIIAFVLILNAIVGAYQEGKAQSAILALRSYEKDKALVRRDGREQLIESAEIVPGDIIIILEGSRIPADARLIKNEDLSVDEAILTGESKTKPKDIDPIKEQGIVPGDRHNMIFKGTYASRGKATAVVVGTGQHTEIGKISSQVDLYETEIPLQTKIKILTNKLVLGIGIALAGMIGIALYQGYALREIFLTSASLLVAVMPEGLPIVVTLVLAQGVQRMAQNNVLIKRLQAVEALGNADVIAVDKTGTLTRNQLSVTQVMLSTVEASMHGEGYDPIGTLTINKTILDEQETLLELEYFALLSGLSANAEIFRQKGTVTVAGDPTEAAMLVFAQRMGLEKTQILKEGRLLDEIAFSYKRKYYANLHKQKDGNVLVVTGAPEVVLDLCATIRKDTETVFAKKQKEEFMELVTRESSLGHRVIALAYKKTTKETLTLGDIEELVFFGIFIMEDQIRQEVPAAMKEAREAKIRVVMITGDYPSTAKTIAEKSGIFTAGDRVLSGNEIEAMSNQALQQIIPTVSVFARVTPEHKLRIIQAFRENGKTIAMTGDGVNDVPSLVAADLGVAMGEIGTEAAKAAADIILLDDDFGNIPKAVEEGKRIFLNIKKVVTYLLSTNIGEVLVVAFALIIGATIPLNPAQIVWLNLLTDSFLVFPLTMEPQQGKQTAGSYSKSLVSKHDVARILVVALAMLGGSIIIRSLYQHESQEVLSTVTLIMVVFSQIWIAYVLRNKKTIRGAFSNRWFWIAVLAVLLFQMGAVYSGWLQTILRTTSVDGLDWLIAILVSLVVPTAYYLHQSLSKALFRK